MRENDFAIKRNRDYGKSDGGDDFDFDAYEGFDKG